MNENINTENPPAPLVPPTRKPRGFQVISKTRQIEIATLGGIKAHKVGKAHKFTPEEAKEAGRKGGLKTSQNRNHMAEEELFRWRFAGQAMEGIISTSDRHPYAKGSISEEAVWIADNLISELKKPKTTENGGGK